MNDIKKMKTLLEACGGPEMGMPEASEGAPVSINVSMNASGKEHVADLLDMMKNAGMPAASEVGPDTMRGGDMRGDMEKFRSAVDDDPAIPGRDDIDGDSDLNASILGTIAGGALGTAAGAATGATGALAGAGGALGAKAGSGIAGAMGKGMLGKAAGAMTGSKIGSAIGSALPSAAGAAIGDKVTNDESIEDDTQYSITGKSEEANAELARMASLSGVDAPQENEEEVEEWANSAPGAEAEDRGTMGDYEDNIHDGNDLHKQKKSYKATAGGDNPMSVESIKAALFAALTEKKAKPDFLDVDKDGDKKEPMKKALKDKGSKPKKGKVPPQFQKATEGRGKVMAGRGRGKKTKVMAGRGRGKQ